MLEQINTKSVRNWKRDKEVMIFQQKQYRMHRVKANLRVKICSLCFRQLPIQSKVHPPSPPKLKAHPWFREGARNLQIKSDSYQTLPTSHKINLIQFDAKLSEFQCLAGWSPSKNFLRDIGSFLLCNGKPLKISYSILVNLYSYSKCLINSLVTNKSKRRKSVLRADGT